MPEGGQIPPHNKQAQPDESALIKTAIELLEQVLKLRGDKGGSDDPTK